MHGGVLLIAGAVGMQPTSCGFAVKKQLFLINQACT